MSNMTQCSVSLGYRFVNILFPCMPCHVFKLFMYYLHYLMMRDFDDETLAIFV